MVEPSLPEIDLIVGDNQPANCVSFAGTIKWRENQPVTTTEVSELAAKALAVPGVTPNTPLVAVCPAGAEPDFRLKQVWTATDLLAAWP